MASERQHRESPTCANGCGTDLAASSSIQSTCVETKAAKKKPTDAVTLDTDTGKSNRSSDSLSGPARDVPWGRSSVAIGERVLHGLMFGLGMCVLVLSWVMQAEGQTRVYLPGIQTPLPELCSSRMLFGVDCPGCGMTRAFISISHGEFRRAWEFNPASFIVYLLIVGQVPWQGFQLWRIGRGQRPIQSNWVYVVPVLAIISILGQWLLRMFLVV